MRAKRKTASNLPSFSQYCSHATWISWNNQSSKAVMEPFCQYCLFRLTTRMYLALGYFFLAL